MQRAWPFPFLAALFSLPATTLSSPSLSQMAATNSNGQTHVTVLIEQKDFTPFGPLRRTSLTPSITTITAGAADSNTSTTSSNNEWRDSNGANIAASRRQRTSTTFHPSLDVPDSLVASLSSTAIVGGCGMLTARRPGAHYHLYASNPAITSSIPGILQYHAAQFYDDLPGWTHPNYLCLLLVHPPLTPYNTKSLIALLKIQPHLLPLPTSRPLVILIQLLDYIPPELSTTPSTVCFPPVATPTAKSISRALTPLKAAISQLDTIGARSGVALLVYSDNIHLPVEISTAAYTEGAHGVILPPFTPTAVEEAIHAAIDRHSKSPIPPLVNPPAVFPPTPESTNVSLPSEDSESQQQKQRPEKQRPEKQRPEKQRQGQGQVVEVVPHHEIEQAKRSPHFEARPGWSTFETVRRGSEHIDPLDPHPYSSSYSPSARRLSFYPNVQMQIMGMGLGENVASPEYETVPIERGDIPYERRSSVDLGGLSLALDPIIESKVWEDQGEEMEEEVEDLDVFVGNRGIGWAGWDSAPASWMNTKLANQRRRSRMNSNYGMGGGDMELADLLLSIHLQSTAALANASSTLNNPGHLAGHSASASQDLLTSPSASVTSGPSPTSSPVQLTAPGSNIIVGPPSSRTRARLINLLSTWHFEPYLFSSSERLLAVQLIFEALLTSLDLPWQTQAPDSTNTSQEQSSKDSQNQNGYPNNEPRITMERNLIPFIHDLAKMYRKDNKYHSFIHALDVLQAVYMFLEREGRVPNICILLQQDSTSASDELAQWTKRRRHNKRRWERWGGQDCQGSGVADGEHDEEKSAYSAIGLLSDEDIFLLCLAAIGHDVGHPGNSNAFLKNAEAPLSKLYEDKSALERMHCMLLLKLMQKHDMGFLISPQTELGKEGRRVLVGTILATDMSWHFQWFEGFGRAMKERRAKASAGGTLEAPDLIVNSSGDEWVLEKENPEEKPVDERSQEEIDMEDRLFLCQALMKCADISNPCRPHSISKHWSTVLLEEWAAQALLERHLGLPVSVVADANEKIQCVGQIGFIKLFTQPLFDKVAEAIPGLSEIAKQCTENKILWEKRLAHFEAIAQEAATSNSGSPSTSSHPRIIRPIPLALPIVSPMSRYAKTVIPLSLPNLQTHKKQPPPAKALASMSPWHTQTSATNGKKKSRREDNAVSRSTAIFGSNANASSRGRPMIHSRPDSISSTSTLSMSSLHSSNGNGSGIGNVGSPTTPTSGTGVQGLSPHTTHPTGRELRTPVSPLLSPFTLALAPSNTITGSLGGASQGHLPSSGQSGAMNTSATLVPNGSLGYTRELRSVWDVDPVRAERDRWEIRKAWSIRDGRPAKRIQYGDFFHVGAGESWAESRRASVDLGSVGLAWSR
ncbi:HD-domain/PDEase-like protein [Serendipita vermifera]|nr:HD-domain/PDEase-like protein [Serendipita vermifera]